MHKTYILPSMKAYEQPVTHNLFAVTIFDKGRPGSSVDIATDYGLDGPGIKSRWGRDFPPVQNGPGAHPASCTMGTGSFPAIKCGRDVTLTTHPFLAPRSWKSRTISLSPLGHYRACNGVTLPLPLYLIKNNNCEHISLCNFV
jgi:hypothetical protein